MHAIKHCQNVVTIEVNPDFRKQAIDEWIRNGFKIMPVGEIVFATQDDGRAIVSYMGDSRHKMSNIIAIAKISGPICFYLDAHWGELPLLGELDVIASQNIPNSVIIFHDFLVPGTNLRCDEYEGKKLSYQFVQNHLRRINPNYRIEYNDESSPAGVGIMYCLP